MDRNIPKSGNAADVRRVLQVSKYLYNINFNYHSNVHVSNFLFEIVLLG